MNILEEKGINKEKLEEMLSRHISKDIVIADYKVKLFKEGVKHNIYKIPITYMHRKNDSANNILFIAKISKEIKEYYYGEDHENNRTIYEIMHGSAVAEFIEQNEYIVKFIGINQQRDLFLMEYAGENSLEKKLKETYDKGQIRNLDNVSLIWQVINALVNTHYDLNRLKIGGIPPLQQQHTNKLHNYIKSILEAKGKTITESLSDQIKEDFKPIDYHLTRGTLDYKPVELSIIHSDLHPAHIFIDPLKIIDFKVTAGPPQFDLVDLLEHPLTYRVFENPRNEINNILSTYLHKMKILQLKTLIGEDAKKVMKNGEIEELPRDFLDIYYLSAFYRGIRIAAKSFHLEQKYPKLYEKLVEENPLYRGYRDWYLSHLKDLFNIMVNEYSLNKKLGKENMNKFKHLYNILADNIEEINSGINTTLIQV